MTIASASCDDARDYCDVDGADDAGPARLATFDQFYAAVMVDAFVRHDAAFSHVVADAYDCSTVMAMSRGLPVARSPAAWHYEI